MSISDWSSDVCSSDLEDTKALRAKVAFAPTDGFRATLSLDHTEQDVALTLGRPMAPLVQTDLALGPVVLHPGSSGDWDYRARTSFDPPGHGQTLEHTGGSLAMEWDINRSEEHTSELQSLMRISYAVFCLKQKKSTTNNQHTN